MRNHWVALQRYLYDARLPIDNNQSERTIRPFVIGRRNWTFLGHPAAAPGRLKLFSIASSAHRHGLLVHDYFEDVLSKLAHAWQREPHLLQPGSEYLQSLLPDHWREPTRRPSVTTAGANRKSSPRASRSATCETNSPRRRSEKTSRRRRSILTQVNGSYRPGFATLVILRPPGTPPQSVPNSSHTMSAGILSPVESHAHDRSSAVANPTIAIQLTPKERALILRYGYPFDQIKQALMDVSSSKRIETVLLDAFEVNQLIGDLCRSINHEEGVSGHQVSAVLAKVAVMSGPRSVAVEDSQA